MFFTSTYEFKATEMVSSTVGTMRGLNPDLWYTNMYQDINTMSDTGMFVLKGLEGISSKEDKDKIVREGRDSTYVLEVNKDFYLITNSLKIRSNDSL